MNHKAFAFLLFWVFSVALVNFGCRSSEDGTLENGTLENGITQVDSPPKNGSSTTPSVADRPLANGAIKNSDSNSTAELGATETAHALPTNESAVHGTATTAAYKIFSWNVESNGAEAKTICQQLKQLNMADKYDIVALTEVLPADLSKFRSALGTHYKYIYSKSGNNDKMQLLYNENKFEKVRQIDLNEINISQRYRAPMALHLKDRTSDVEFMVMVNHLARGKAKIRQQQATMLVEWARDQTLPIFAVGDYNFDFVFETEKGNPAFVNFLKDNIWRWVKPTEFIDTNWYDNPEEPDGKDDYPGSMLDFAFVAGPAKEWDSTCNVIVREGDFPDNEKTSDHRPFELLISK
ncbi:MAG: endonuclease/exonuclease/phosphatase family protein [Mariniblastus sp.]